MTKHVVVLMGGPSAEREVSLRSGAACAKALEGEGFRVSSLDVVPANVAQDLMHLKPDVVLNALHGSFGEDGTMQGILEALAIPYTHSGVLASALAMDKTLAKVVLEKAGLPVAQGLLASRKDLASAHVLPPPYVIKPNAEGSSVGVVVVMNGDAPPKHLLDEGDGNEMLLIEAFAPGRELTCAIMGDRSLGVTEIVPAEGFYDYKAKYAQGGSFHVCPAQIKPDIYQDIEHLSLKAHQALGCRGVSRTDFRYDDTPGAKAALICLEVNTQPGMTGTSLVPELAAHSGLSFGALVRWMVEDASLKR